MLIHHSQAHLILFPKLSVSEFIDYYTRTHKESVSRTHIIARCKDNRLDYTTIETTQGKRYYIFLNDKAKDPFIDKRISLYKGRKKSLRYTARQIKEKGQPFRMATWSQAPKPGNPASLTQVFRKVNKTGRALIKADLIKMKQAPRQEQEAPIFKAPKKPHKRVRYSRQYFTM